MSVFDRGSGRVGRRRSVAVSALTAVVAVVSMAQPAAAADVHMGAGFVLLVNQERTTGTGEILRVQGDGNVVLYVNGGARWHTNTNGHPTHSLRVQSDGNVVVYNNAGQWLWQSRTYNQPGGFLRLQDDGNLVVYSAAGTAVWAASWTQDPTGAKTYSQFQFALYGWSVGSQFPCLDSLWTRESGWRWNATNPSSGAYGIPQALPGSKMATAGTNWQNDGLTQVQWGLNYIRDRYGSPCGAWNHFQRNGWY